jgi:very-short-patch-repair endonuclease
MQKKPFSLELLLEWHPTKNGDLKPDQVLSKDLIWWLDKSCGHSYLMRIARKISGAGCTICGGSQLLAGFNDLVTVNPVLAAEWHPTKNGTLKPSDVFATQSGIVWWQCKLGHEWEISPNGRRNRGCPYCSNRRVLAGYNDLATTHPHLAAEWHPMLNGELLPTQVSYGQGKTIYWLCLQGHSYPMSLNTRSRGLNCGICAGQSVLTGFNDLATTHPNLATEWHPTLNGELLPTQISKGHNAKIFWLGKCGHAWPATVGSRTSSKSGCSVCGNRLILMGFNDLATVNPILASEWHPTKNGTLLPTQVFPKARETVYWLGKCGHEWAAAIYSRAAGRACKECAEANMVSQAEKEIFTYLSSLGFLVEQTNRKLLKGKELDLYLPKEKFAIEFNGIHWHSEQMGKDKTYHYNKWLECQKVGVKLIQVWEDNWIKNKEVVLQTITQKLDTAIQPIINNAFAKLTVRQTKEFMNTNHIEGFETGDCYLGVFDSNKTLNAAIILKQEKNNSLTIIRYASANYHSDNFTKLIGFIQKEYTPEKLVVIDDNCMSESNIYELNGFIMDSSIKPDYSKVIGHKRYPKDAKLVSKVEKRIWDAGQTCWIKILTY